MGIDPRGYSWTPPPLPPPEIDPRGYSWTPPPPVPARAAGAGRSDPWLPPAVEPPPPPASGAGGAERADGGDQRPPAGHAQCQADHLPRDAASTGEEKQHRNAGGENDGGR
jgi:hypothetical protein